MVAQGLGARGASLEPKTAQWHRPKSSNRTKGQNQGFERACGQGSWGQKVHRARRGQGSQEKLLVFGPTPDGYADVHPRGLSPKGGPTGPERDVPKGFGAQKGLIGAPTGTAISLGKCCNLLSKTAAPLTC